MSGPLSGLKVLDFTHVLAGPFATRILGDMGADVVKVNSADRADGANDPEHPYYLMWNRNKRALAINMANEESRAVCRRLCETADVVIDNFSVGVLDRWGVGFDAVSQTNEGVIYVQMSGMGDGGPWSKYVTYAPTIHALAGLTHMTGVPGREDIGIGFSYNDHQAGLHGAVAILAALEARRRTGRGQRVDLSQFEVGATFAGPSLMDYFANDSAARPTGNRLPYDKAAPHGVYRCAGEASDAVEDERWVAIACMSDEHWRALKAVMGEPDWAQDTNLDTVDGRLASEETLNANLETWTRQLDATDVMTQCQAAGVPAGVVQTGVDLAERDPQLAEAGFLTPIEDVDPNIGQTYAERLPIHFSRTPCDNLTRVRAIGEDNVSVLGDWLGMPEDAVRAGEDNGLFV